ncbi:MAG: cytochrome c-type protein NapC [Gammaproteobacteria bacterium]
MCAAKTGGSCAIICIVRDHHKKTETRKVMETKTKALLLFLVCGVVLGVAATAGFSQALSYSNTDVFCLSCHNHEIPNAEYKLSKHYSNAYGISPMCSDCHVPHEFGPKMWRKALAAKEVFAHFTGKIDTDAKYMAHREEMKTIEIARFKANDSAECRHCHQKKHMDFSVQSKAAQQSHLNKSEGKTCIDCHAGIVHTPEVTADDFDF